MASSGELLEVPAGASLLQVLEAHGIALDSSCREGTCGSCKIPYLEGQILHRDHVLSKAERGRVMAPCVSRACGTVVLDL